MSTVQEIEAAIRSLAPAQREELAKDLPALLPELDGDAAWERIIRDGHPRPAFTTLLNEVLRTRQTELQERFQREDIAWAVAEAKPDPK